MNVLLLNAPWSKGEMWGVRAGSRWPHIKNREEKEYLPYPFFLGYSASLLKKNNIPVLLIDAIAEKLCDEDFYERCTDFHPDFILLEVSLPSLSIDLAYAKELKEKTGAKIAITGPVTHLHTKEFHSENSFIDFTFIGEYELSLLNLVNALKYDADISQVKGITFMDDSGFHHTGRAELLKLDDLPWPMREGVPLFKYWDVPGDIPTPSVQMMASRGCPFNCVFCAWPPLMYGGHIYRTRDPKDVVDEMEYLVKELHFKSVYFDDDTFNIGKERLIAICHEIKKRNLKVPWAIMARADLMDEELLRELKSAGLAAVKYGVETADEEIMKKIDKKIDLKKTKEIIKQTHQLGIKTHLTFTFGTPGETRETIMKTIDFAIELNPHSLQFSITTPYPGTKFYEECEEKGYLIDSDNSCFDGNFKSVIETPELKSDDLQKLMRFAYSRWGDHILQRNRLRNKIKKLFTLSFNDKKELVYEIKKVIQYQKEKQECKKKEKEDFNKYVSEDKQLLGVFSEKLAFVGPATVQLDITDHCNNSCLGCWCRSPLLKEKKTLDDELEFEKIKLLIDDLKKLSTKSIYLSGSGDPSVHPHFMEIVRYIKASGFECHINTNLINISLKDLEEFVDLGVDHLVASVWAGNPDTYVELHPNQTKETFDNVYGKLEHLGNYKSKYFKVKPFTKIYNVMCNKNADNVWSMMEMAIKTKSTTVEYTVMDTIPNETDVLDLTPEQAKEMIAFGKEIIKTVAHKHYGSEGSYTFFFEDQELTFYKFDQFLRRLDYIVKSKTKKKSFDKNIIHSIPCTTPWQFVRIVPNGDVHACLKSHRIPVGNINTETFESIWNNKSMQNFRSHVIKKRKEGEFFSKIGNDPQAVCGCEVGCDDLDRNLTLFDKIKKINPETKEIMIEKAKELSKSFNKR